MAYEPTIQYAEKIADLTLNGLVLKGNVLAHNGTNWVQADASDAATNLYGQYIAMQGGASGDVITGCKGCVLYDRDAPFGSANATLYLSATAGAITSTRPATNGDVIQVVGRSISTSLARIDIASPQEKEEFIPANEYNLLDGGSLLEGRAVHDTIGEWMGTDVDGAYAAAIFSGFFPSNMVGAPLAADLIVVTQSTTALDIDVTYVRAYIGGTASADVGATQSALTSGATTADNSCHKVSILTGMDADFAKAGAPFGLKIDPDAGDFKLIGLSMRYLVV